MSAPVRARTRVAPLLDLLRTTLAHCDTLTLRVLPADDEHAATGCVDPAEQTVYLPARRGPDDAALLVQALYALVAADTDPRLDESAAWFVTDATRGTLAAMGEQGPMSTGNEITNRPDTPTTPTDWRPR